MGSRPWVRVGEVVRSAVIPAALSLALAVTAMPACAQLYDEALRATDLSPDPLSRSPRMAGMGRLTLVLDDVHHRYDVWEFTGNPAGLLDADSVSTLELYPGTAAQSAVHDEPADRERQDLAVRSLRLGYEAWRRQSGSTAFGVIGDFGRLRTDVPLTIDTERRTQFNVPNTMLALCGRLAFLDSERLRYGLAIRHRYQGRDDDYRTIVSNGAGEYLDKDGTEITSPDLFVPIRYGVRSLGGTFGLAYRVSPWLHLAGDYDYLGNKIEGRNDGVRYSFELRESRPVNTVTGAALGDAAGLRYGIIARHWSTGPNEQRWVATLSTGSGQIPVVSRGLYAKRKESGTEFRGRATWSLGALALAAGGSHVTRSIDTTAPAATDPTSFNLFLDQVSSLNEADSLALPDSVVANGADERVNEAGGGAMFSLPWRQAIVAAEMHADRATVTQTFGGEGPNPRGWDVRSGLEFRGTEVLVLRGGYIYRHDDRDALTSQNEYVSQTATAGFGLHPGHASWTLETSYGITWTHSDFGDPSRLRSNEQRGLVRLRWVL